jgi:hypothetical protein
MPYYLSSSNIINKSFPNGGASEMMKEALVIPVLEKPGLELFLYNTFASEMTIKNVGKVPEELI